MLRTVAYVPSPSCRWSVEISRTMHTASHLFQLLERAGMSLVHVLRDCSNVGWWRWLGLGLAGEEERGGRDEGVCNLKGGVARR